MSSLKSKLRGRLMESRGARKNTRNNLWINYSLKLGRDITLTSNNECWYWVSALETDPLVSAFKFGCELKVKYDWESQFCRRDLILVVKVDGSSELHHISASAGTSGLFPGLILDDQGNTEQETIHITTPKDVRGLAPRSLCWLQFLGFGNQIKNEELSAEGDMVSLHLRSRISGSVEGLLEDLAHIDPMVVLGLLAREVTAGIVAIEFMHGSFGRHSIWSLRPQR